MVRNMVFADTDSAFRNAGLYAPSSSGAAIYASALAGQKPSYALPGQDYMGQMQRSPTKDNSRVMDPANLYRLATGVDPAANYLSTTFLDKVQGAYKH
jgi:hypothetical protein